MSKKPSIYGYCPAGCKWETVHRDDFIAAATYVKVTEGNEDYKLEVGKQYKIFADFIDNDYTKGFNCTLYFKHIDQPRADTYITRYNIINIPNEDKYANSFVFKFLDAIIGEEVISGETRRLTIVYEISGVRYTEDLIVSDGVTVDTDNCLLVRTYGKDIYLYNDYANYTAVGKDGENGLTALCLAGVQRENGDPDATTIPTLWFNRNPLVGEKFNYYHLNQLTNILYIVDAEILSNDGQEVNTIYYGSYRISGSITSGSAQQTLTAAGWDSTTNTQTISLTINTANRNEIDVDPASIEEWANCGVVATSESSTGITFKCKTIPTNDLIFRVISSEVDYAG